MIEPDVPILGKKLIAQLKKRREYVPGRVLCRVRPPAVRSALGAARLKLDRAGAKCLPVSLSELLDDLRRNAGLKAIHPLFSTQRARIERASVSPADRTKLAILSSVVDSEVRNLRVSPCFPSIRKRSPPS